MGAIIAPSVMAITFSSGCSREVRCIPSATPSGLIESLNLLRSPEVLIRQGSGGPADCWPHVAKRSVRSGSANRSRTRFAAR